MRIIKLIGLSCYHDLTPNSCNKFNRKWVAAREENSQSDLGSLRVNTIYIADGKSTSKVFI